MSNNIFYTEVDPFLQTELNARAKAGFRDRSNTSLNYMLGKVANVQVTAFEGTGSQGEIVGILGGAQTRTGRFQPNEFLSDSSYEEDVVKFYETDIDPVTRVAAALQGKKVEPGRAYASTNVLVDKSRRVGPYLTDCNINIGDHSFGLLNKATFQFTVPNVTRDLDAVEDIYFRPGRFIRIDVVHPESAIISKDETDNNILLSETVIPNDKKLAELYPGLVKEKLENFKKQARKMNQYRFEGLITNFNFSYDTDGSVNASINLTGTSNVYTDLSMVTNAGQTKKKSENPSNYTTVTTGPVIDTAATETGSNYVSQFYEQLYVHVEETVANNILINAANDGVIDNSISEIENAANEGTSFELLQSLDTATSDKLPKSMLVKSNTDNSQQNTSIATDNWILKGEPWSPIPKGLNKFVDAKIYDYRYITLGALISFLNDRILNLKTDPNTAVSSIICSDKACSSNYYQSLVSANPTEILLLPPDPSRATGMNAYGRTVFYQNILEESNLNDDNENTWPGVYSTEKDANSIEKILIYPSRIFINLSVINDITKHLSNEGRNQYNVVNFLNNISSKITYNTGGAIQLKLVTHPTLEDVLLFTDVKNIQPIIDPEKSEGSVTPYEVPMFANHPTGTICHNFSFNSKLPDNAKNLAYVLNSSDEISESDIAPFVNFMYTAGSGDVDEINKFLDRYEKKHLDAVAALAVARKNYGDDPYSEETTEQLRTTLFEYLKFPTKNLQESSQLSAPVFPFETEFTIDGINGLRYGDVVQFLALPKRYRINTSFSIIGITHNIDNKGFWTSTVKCIMRPNITNLKT